MINGRLSRGDGRRRVEDGVGSPVVEREESEMRAHKLETSRSGTKRDGVERYKLV